MKTLRCLPLFTAVLFTALPAASLAQTAVLSLCDTEPADSRTLASMLVDDTRLYLGVSPATGTDVILSGCDTLPVPVSENAVRWGRVTNNPLLANTATPVILQGQFTTATTSVSEIILPDPTPPTRNSVGLTPAGPRVPSAVPVNYRSGWFWQPAFWQQDPARLWAAIAEHDLDRVYLTIPTRGDRVENPAQLAAFLNDAHTRGVDVWAVVGDRRDVIADNLPLLLERANAYLAYNATQPDASRLDGLQLDIEPYLLQGFNLDQDHWRNRYVATIRAVHDTLAGNLSLDLVMPVWWGIHPQWGEQLLANMALAQTSITVMNYRADIDRLRREAEPFLDWGERADVPVHMALEYGELQDELRQHFYSDTSGELWHLDIGTRQVLVLLDSAYANLPGTPRKMAFTSEFRADALTFNGDPERLASAIATLSQDWSAWTSFAGIAIHGMEALTTAGTAP